MKKVKALNGLKNVELIVARTKVFFDTLGTAEVEDEIAEALGTIPGYEVQEGLSDDEKNPQDPPNVPEVTEVTEGEQTPPDEPESPENADSDEGADEANEVPVETAAEVDGEGADDTSEEDAVAKPTARRKARPTTLKK